MSDITINALDGSRFGGYASLPESGSGPGLVVIQEIFGVNAVMRSLCDGFAAHGYIAVCPDLFWRQAPGAQLTDKTDAEWKRAMELFNGFDVEAGMRDLLATLAHVRGMPGCSGKVGAVGYCLGGKLAWLMAARSDVDCTVSYYGVGLETMLDEMHDIRMPFMLHIAENDEFVPLATRQKILAAVKHNPVIDAYTYPGAEHAFARPGGQKYLQEAAVSANSRTTAFLTEHLLT